MNNTINVIFIRTYTFQCLQCIHLLLYCIVSVQNSASCSALKNNFIWIDLYLKYFRFFWFNICIWLLLEPWSQFQPRRWILFVKYLPVLCQQSIEVMQLFPGVPWTYLTRIHSMHICSSDMYISVVVSFKKCRSMHF